MLSAAAGLAALQLVPPGAKQGGNAPTSVSLSDQGLVQMLEAAVTGLEPGRLYLLALANDMNHLARAFYNLCRAS
jgi:hypothetical protein